MRITDIFYAIPFLVMAMALVVAIGRGLKAVIIVLIILEWPSYTRVLRSDILVTAEQGLHPGVACQRRLAPSRHPHPHPSQRHVLGADPGLPQHRGHHPHRGGPVLPWPGLGHRRRRTGARSSPCAATGSWARRATGSPTGTRSSFPGSSSRCSFWAGTSWGTRCGTSSIPRCEGDSVRRTYARQTTQDLFTNFYTFEGVVRALNGVSHRGQPGGDLRAGRGERLRQERHRPFHDAHRAGAREDRLRPDLHVPEPGGPAKGIEIVQRTEAYMESIRGCDISMIFQEPGAALNPVLSIGEQIAESYRFHRMDSMLAETSGAGGGERCRSSPRRAWKGCSGRCSRRELAAIRRHDARRAEDRQRAVPPGGRDDPAARGRKADLNRHAGPHAGRGTRSSGVARRVPFLRLYRRRLRADDPTGTWWSSCAASGSRTRRTSRRATRTSFPAACSSASSSPSPWPAIRRSSSRMSRPPTWT